MSKIKSGFRRFASMLTVLATAGAFATAMGCGEYEEIVHPAPDFLPGLGGPLLVSRSLPAAPLSTTDSVQWVGTRQRLVNATPGLSLGALEGDAPDVFGQVVAVELDSRGNIYVLDRINHELRAFSPSGEFLGAAGGVGDGPTEFRFPFSMELVEDGFVAVAADAGLIKTYSLSTGGFVFHDSYRSKVTPEDACVSGGRFFALNWNRHLGNFLIHELKVGREQPLRSFGAGYAAGHWIVHGKVNAGRLACAGDPARILFAYMHVPVLAAFTPDGDPLWTSRVTDYMQQPIIESMDSEGPGVHIGDVTPADMLATLNPISRRHALAQYARLEDTDAIVPQVTMRTYLVDLATGHGSLISEGLPGIMAISPDRFVTLRPLPYPTLRVWHMHIGELES